MSSNNSTTPAPGDSHQGGPSVVSSETLSTSQRRDDDNEAELQEHASTPEPSPGFSVPPSRSQLVEVCIPSMDARTRAEYDRVSDISGAYSHTRHAETASLASVASNRSQHSKKQVPPVARFPSTLDLGRFAYKGNNPIAHSTLDTRRGQIRRRKTGATRAKIARPGSTSQQARAQVARDQKMRTKSLFIRAAGHHQQR